MTLPVHTSDNWASDETMIAALRLVLAVLALAVIYLNPTEPNRYVDATYTTLVLYVLYSSAAYCLLLHPGPLWHTLDDYSHWIDVGWYALLVGLSQGTNSVFFFGFFFAILVASFRWGFLAGLRVTFVSALLFTVISLEFIHAEAANFKLNRFLLRPIYLLVLGYMMAYRGGFEIMLKRRLALLKDVAAHANPRFGVDQTVGALMEQLRAFYDAEACLLIEADKTKTGFQLRRVDRRDPQAAVRAKPIPPEMVRLLGTLSPEQAAVHGSTPHLWGWWPTRAHEQVYDVVTGERRADRLVAQEALVAALDYESFVTVPLRYQGETMGRLYLVAGRRQAFEESDVSFLQQVVEHAMPILDNIRLVDQFAADAAEEERRRIAFDLHDSVIQPYLGLQMGLAALSQKLHTDGMNVREDVERLLAMTSAEVAELRGYMKRLRNGGGYEEGLGPAVQRFAAKFTEATGIAVHVQAGGDILLSERLAAEVFQMVAEGLSNIRRHTNAMRATLDLACRDDRLIVEIADEGTEGKVPLPFTPRSLTGRAAALGGSVRVEPHKNSGSVVIIAIPL